ncbi:MAG: trypsin-like serine peptidase [Acidimicrobiales bacterium]
MPEDSLLVDDVAEVVHGRDDRVRVSGTRSYPWRSICHLKITSATGSVHSCSGTLIGPRTVLTNGHCVFMHSRGGWVKKIEVTPGRNGSTEPFGSATSSHFISTKGWVKDRSYNYDYAVIVLPKSQNLGNVTGWMGLANLSFFSLMGLKVNNSGYPGDKPPGTQWWNSNNVLAVTARRVYYRLDTYNGQSGSPIWRYKNRKRHIIAVHNTGSRSFNGSVRINKAVFDNLVRWKNTYT